MKDMTVETLNFIILCMGLLFVMAGILLIVGKLAGKRPASIAVGVLMIAWGLLCGIPELRSWMLARATDLEHTLEAMWAGLDGDGQIGPAADERGLAVQRMVLAAFDHVHRRRPARFTALPAAKARLDDG